MPATLNECMAASFVLNRPQTGSSAVCASPQQGFSRTSGSA